MTGATIIQGSVKMLPQGLPKVIDELGIPVRGDGIWHPIQAHNFFKKQIGHSSSIWSLPTCYEMEHLRVPVNHNKNKIHTSLGSRKT